MSKDSGDSWVYVNRDYVAHLTSYFQVASVVPIPFERVPQTFEPAVTGTGCTLYTIRDWNFCYDGIYYKGIMVFTWNYI
ncbi:unnamed protein product [Hymenolepis diminuta]|nr:unnamed protein product [Hymenolepis diminuta]